MNRPATRFGLGIALALCGCQTPLTHRPVVPFVRAEPFFGPSTVGAATHATGDPGVETAGAGGDVAAGPAEQMVRLELRDALQRSLASSDVVRVLAGGGVAVTPTTRLDPQIASAAARRADAQFDPQLELGYIGSRINEPPSSFFGPGIPAATRRDEGDFVAGVTKPWATGTQTSIYYDAPLSYLFFPDGTSGPFNPAYESGLVFEARQNLLRGAGTAVNVAPIRVAHLRAGQESWQVRQATIEQVRSVEEAYWQLQAAVVARQAVEVVIPLAEEVARIQQARLANELITRADLARAEAQLKEFRQRWARADLATRSGELRLRNLVGIPSRDPVPLIPVDAPRRQPVLLDTSRSVELAWAHNPELVRKRIDVEIRGNELIVAENGVLPKLDVFARVKAGGLADKLDDSIDQALGMNYTDWTLGASFAVPLGNRAPQATRDESRLRAAREKVLLEQLEENVAYRIAEIVATTNATWEQYTLAQGRADDTLKWVQISRTRFAQPPPTDAGKQDWLTVLLVDYQQALQAHLDAIGDAAVLLAEYNTLLARLEAAQGTLLGSREIRFEGDPNPVEPSCVLPEGDVPAGPPGAFAPAGPPSSPLTSGGAPLWAPPPSAAPVLPLPGTPAAPSPSEPGGTPAPGAGHTPALPGMDPYRSDYRTRPPANL